MKKIFFVPLVLGLTGLLAASCSDDKKDEPENPGDATELYFVDELQDLQASIAKVDEQGNLVERVLGVSLDAADPDEVTVGVESLDEAKEIFRSLFADTTLVSADGLSATLTTRKGSASLQTPDGGAAGLIAKATFDVPGLKYVSAVNFISNSAWPENASEKGFHKLGVKYQYKGWTGPSTLDSSNFDENQLFDYVCIREYKNGKPALLAAITPDEYYLNWRKSDGYSGNIPNKAKAEEIAKIMQGNWSAYKSYYKVGDREILNDGTQCWINDGSDSWFSQKRVWIRLKDSYTKSINVHSDDPTRAVLFYIESGQKL